MCVSFIHAGSTALAGNLIVWDTLVQSSQAARNDLNRMNNTKRMAFLLP
jgi:hypothetical protein